MTKFTAACVQLSSTNDLRQNFTQASELIKNAADAGADIILTPECVAFMAENNQDLLANSFIEQENWVLNEFQKLARDMARHLVIGSLAIKQEGIEKLYNRSYLIDDKGEITCAYDKIHLYDADLPNGKVYRESDSYLAGDELKIVDLPWGKLGMSICYDVRFPHLFRQLAQNGADFLSIPAAFVNLTGQAHWEVLLRARAIENGCFVFAPAQTGEHPGQRRTYGHSLIIDPWGRILADGGKDEGFIMAEIDTSLIEETRASLASLAHDREFGVV